MFGQTFYHKTLRKNVALFGTLFNDIYINREGTNGETVETIRVPITYGPKEKTLARVNEDPNLDRPYSITLPRMSFEMTGMQYDPSRKLATTNKGYAVQDTTGSSSADKLKYMYNPVPYNINFTLYVMARYAEDGTRILEQILPYFAPEWTATVNLIPEMNVALDIPTIIQDVSLSDSYEGSMMETRTIIWTINFTMKTYLFGPIRRAQVVTGLASTKVDFDSGVLNTYIKEYPDILAPDGSNVSVNVAITTTDVKQSTNGIFDYVINATRL